ncbi:MAG: cytochrome c, partial [Verrucomicrobiota bacterium]|nr:cytochrome c [Verrucomicrobiota bacterium]
ALSRGISANALSAGRQTFVSRCTACHALPAINGRTAGAWPQAVGEMAGRANLTAEQREQLSDYLVSARQSM